MTYSIPIDQTIGFTVLGAAPGDFAGWGISSAGDINNDGIDDFAVAAHLASPGGNDRSGATYVLYGRAEGFTGVVDLAQLATTDGIMIAGASALAQSGVSISEAGDVNGDGIDDLIIGAIDEGAGDIAEAGKAYVVFGRTGGIAADIDLGNLDGEDGFALEGYYAYGGVGGSVSAAGDVNGDGIDDIIIGGLYAGPTAEFAWSAAGQSYVVFGRQDGFEATIELSSLDGTNGFSITGIESNDQSGTSVAGIGDINNDGFDDVAVGAPWATARAWEAFAGVTYVVFGTDQGFDADIAASSLDGINGFIIEGAELADFSGYKISSAGDFNGDGIADLAIGASSASLAADRNYAGITYIIYGRSGGFDARLDLGALSQTDGFAIIGDQPEEFSGFWVSSAGDFNGDGVDDLIIGSAPRSSNFAVQNIPKAYVIYGNTDGYGDLLYLRDLAPTEGFEITGLSEDQDSVWTVSGAGDINHDGLDDVIVGSRNSIANDRPWAGQATIIYGFRPDFEGSVNGDTFDGTAEGDRALGLAGDDQLSGFGGADTLFGGDGADTVVGGDGADNLYGNTGDDDLVGGAGNDTLSGGDGADSLSGGDGDDSLSGGAGDDLLIGDGQSEAEITMLLTEYGVS